MKLNKNGIPVLDPPGNKMPKKKSCLPDEHMWVDDDFHHGSGHNYICLKCDDKDFVPEPMDEDYY